MYSSFIASRPQVEPDKAIAYIRKNVIDLPVDGGLIAV